MTAPGHPRLPAGRVRPPSSHAVYRPTEVPEDVTPGGLLGRAGPKRSPRPHGPPHSFPELPPVVPAARASSPTGASAGCGRPLRTSVLAEPVTRHGCLPGSSWRAASCDKSATRARTGSVARQPDSCQVQVQCARSVQVFQANCVVWVSVLLGWGKGPLFSHSSLRSRSFLVTRCPARPQRLVVVPRGAWGRPQCPAHSLCWFPSGRRLSLRRRSPLPPPLGPASLSAPRLPPHPWPRGQSS